MTDPETRALSARLDGFLRSSHPGAEAVDLRRLSHRWQVQIFRFGLVDNGARTDAVLRLYEGPDGVRRSCVETELAANLAAQGFPVPGLLGHSADPKVLGHPFQIVRYISGSTLAQEMSGAGEAQLQRCIERFMRLLVRLHRLPLRAVAPAALLSSPLHAGRFQQALISKARVSIVQAHRLVEFEPLLAWIDAASAHVRWSDPVLTHNDFHPGNVLCDADGVDRLIDWATVNVSDHRYDLGWTLMLAAAYWGPSGRASVLRAYQAALVDELDSIDVFVLIAAVRRLMLRGVVAHAGTKGIGMPARPMFDDPGEVEHLRAVYALVPQICGLRLPGIERVLDGLR